MSNTEFHVGKLRKVIPTPTEEWYKAKCKERNPSVKEKSYKDIFFNSFYYEYLLIDDEVWENIDHVEFDEDNIATFTENDDGTISYVVGFYNGGTCFSEVMEDGVSQLLKNKK